MTRILVVAAVTLALVPARPHAQARPDFSGRWTVADPSSGRVFGTSFTATQDADTLNLDIVGGSVYMTCNSQGSACTMAPDTRPDRRTYDLSGGETRVTYPPSPAPAPPANLAGTAGNWYFTPAFTSRPESAVSRVGWQGDQLVIVTHNIQMVTAPNRTPSEVQVERTVRYTLTLGADGRLDVEQLMVADPLPWPSPSRMGPLDTRTTVYKKVS